MPASPLATPRHVAIIMDGNRRWAKKRLLPAAAGHRKGLEALRACIEHCRTRSIDWLTVFAFSSENWQREREEVSALMQLMGEALSKEAPRLSEQGVRLRFVGESAGLNADLLTALRNAEKLTQNNTRQNLIVAFNYGGRWDIVQAARQALQSGCRTEELDEASLARFMALAFAPDPDLLIRTGAEQRISNFLLWQLAYTELFFSPCLWPDFDAAHFDSILADFAQRQRRIGQ